MGRKRRQARGKGRGRSGRKAARGDDDDDDTQMSGRAHHAASILSLEQSAGMSTVSAGCSWVGWLIMSMLPGVATASVCNIAMRVAMPSLYILRCLR